MQLTFHVSGSKGDAYVVKAGLQEPNNLWMRCTCQAGQKGMYCKHRFALLDGDITNLASDNSDDVVTLGTWLQGSDVQAAMAEVERRQADADEAKKLLSAAKKALARALRD